MRNSITLAILLLAFAIGARAQEILGTVTDNKKEPLVNASVSVKQGGVLKGATLTDFDGKYNVKQLEPGNYDVSVAYVGYKPSTITKVIVTPGGKTVVDVKLQPANAMYEVEVKEYKRKIVDKYREHTVLTAEEIRTRPSSQTADLVALTPSIYQAQRGANLYVVNGVQVYGNAGVDIAQGATEQLYINPSEESYSKVHQNDFMNVKSSPVSTMSVDVDRASYTNIRRFINSAQRPPADAVRVEEMVNYFDYDYPQPDGNDPVAFTTRLTTCPWNKDHQILHIGLQAKKVNSAELPASNLVFLVDVSGSMMEPAKLPLVQQGLNMLVDQLRAQDRISLVVYAGNAGLVLPATSGSNKTIIKDAVNRLIAGGSTAGGEGIMLAYKVAKDNFIKGGNNRVILCTDGDFNVGVSSNNELEDLITEERKSGVFLTCLGFGSGNYKDDRMEMLADKGNGNYNYIDNLQEANKTLVHEFGGTIFTVAKDVKCQIEFNPAMVAGYKLIGYENRLLNNEDFKDDKKDAGDMGSGHTVTVMYEIIPAGRKDKDTRMVEELKYQAAVTDLTHDGELATIKLRYKQPDDSVSKEMSHVIAGTVIPFEKTDDNVRYATSVAMFGLLLRQDKNTGNASYAYVLKIAAGCKEKDEYRREFAQLVQAEANMEKRSSAK